MGGQERCQELTEVYMINVLVFWMLFPEWIQMEEIKNNNKNITEFSFLLQIKIILAFYFFFFSSATYFSFFLGKVLFPTKKLTLSHAPQNPKQNPKQKRKDILLRILYFLNLATSILKDRTIKIEGK